MDNRWFGLINYGTGYCMRIGGKDYGFIVENKWEAIKSGFHFWWINRKVNNV